MENVDIYSKGIVACSACVPKDMSKEDIEQAVNAKLPTGISSQWKISEDEKFREGLTNPCVCEADSNKLHYLLNC